MAVSDARPIPRYGESYRLYLPLFFETGDIMHLENVSAELSKDGAAFQPVTNTVVSIASSGFYYIDLTAEEMTAHAVIVQLVPEDARYKSSPAILYPEQAGDMRTHVLTMADPATGEIATAVLSEHVPGTYNPDTLGGLLGSLLEHMPTRFVLVSPVLEGGNLVLVRGDDYLTVDGRAITWSDHGGSWPDLVDAEVFLVIHSPKFFRKVISVPSPSSSPKVVQAELTAAETRKFTSAVYNFLVEAVLSTGSRVTLMKGNIRMIGGL